VLNSAFLAVRIVSDAHAPYNLTLNVSPLTTTLFFSADSVILYSILRINDVMASHSSEVRGNSLGI
jgi:hypothetical protein